MPGRIKHSWEKTSKGGGLKTEKISLVRWRERGLARRRFLNSERKRKMARMNEILQESTNTNLESIESASITKIEANLLVKNLMKFHERRKRMTIKSLKALTKTNDKACIPRRIVRDKLFNETKKPLENFEKEDLRKILKNKEKRVGEVVLVDGRPALIKKRVIGNNGDILRRSKLC